MTQQHLPYRIIALDLDGTLTNHDKEITPLTLLTSSLFQDMFVSA